MKGNEKKVTTQHITIEELKKKSKAVQNPFIISVFERIGIESPTPQASLFYKLVFHPKCGTILPLIREALFLAHEASNPMTNQRLKEKNFFR